MKTPHRTRPSRRLTAIVLAALPQLGCVSDLEYELHRHEGNAEAEAPSADSESDSRQLTNLAIDDDAVEEHDNLSMIDASTTGSAPDSRPPARGSTGDAPPSSEPHRDAMTTVTEVPKPIAASYEDASSPDESLGHGECDADTCGTDEEVDPTAASEGGCSPQPCANDPGVIGTACADADECASGHCLEGSCAELDLVITHQGVDEELQDFLAVHFVIERGTVAVNWEDLAFLYFFTPEVHYDFHTAYDSDSESSRLCVGVDTDLWAYVWRSSKVGPVQWIETSFTALVNDETWAPMNNANDYSYAEAVGPNPNVVVCRQVGSRWFYAQGNVPPGVGDPCWVVEPDCSQASCDDPTD